jgi:hypothetical protein
VIVLHVAEDQPAPGAVPYRAFGEAESRCNLLDAHGVAHDIEHAPVAYLNVRRALRAHDFTSMAFFLDEDAAFTALRQC